MDFVKRPSSAVTAFISKGAYVLIALVVVHVMTGPAISGSPAGVGSIKESPKVFDQISDDRLMTLNFFQVDIRQLLSALAMKREINIVMSQDISGKVSLHLFQATLDEALNAITLAGGFDYMKQKTTYYIYKPKEARDPEAERLEMRVFKLQYAEIEKVQEVLDAIPGKRLIQIHEHSKTIIVEDIPENIKKVETILSFLDRAPRQVMIEAKILEVSLTDEMSMGVNWEQLLGDVRIGTGGFSTAISPAIPPAVPFSPVPGEGKGVFANVITGAGSWKQFTAALNALQTKTKVNTLSTPKILAIHGKPARVQVGGQQGYKETTLTATGAAETVKFLETGTILDITPYIDDEGSVLLNVNPSINSVTIDAATGIPTVISTAVSTWLLAKNGETAFIGGLIQDRKSRTREMIPCLGSIPGLGVLFGRTLRGTGKSELVVLITPTISDAELKRIDQEAMEKTRQIEEDFKKEPLRLHKEILDIR